MDTQGNKTHIVSKLSESILGQTSNQEVKIISCRQILIIDRY